MKDGHANGHANGRPPAGAEPEGRIHVPRNDMVVAASLALTTVSLAGRAAEQARQKEGASPEIGTDEIVAGLAEAARKVILSLGGGIPEGGDAEVPGPEAVDRLQKALRRASEDPRAVGVGMKPSEMFLLASCCWTHAGVAARLDGGDRADLPEVSARRFLQAGRALWTRAAAAFEAASGKRPGRIPPHVSELDPDGPWPELRARLVELDRDADGEDGDGRKEKADGA